MNRAISLFCSLVFVLLVNGLRAEEAERDIGYQPVELEFNLETGIPIEIRHLDMRNPQVKFKVIVDPEGKISDYLAIEATHYLLLKGATEKLQEASFIPARRDGVPDIGFITVTVTFSDPDQSGWKSGGGMMPTGGTVSDAAENKLYQMNPGRFAYEESKPKSLDARLSIKETKFHKLTPPGEEMAKGKVVVEYYVDHEGNVRLPKIISSDDEYLSLSVLKTLEDTHFIPPQRNERPTFVRVRQPFNFS